MFVRFYIWSIMRIFWMNDQWPIRITHWGRVMHICVSKLIIIGSGNGLSPDRRQAIIWTNAGLLLIGPFETNFSEILIEILIFSFKKMHLKVSSAKRRPFCLGLNVLCCTLVLITSIWATWLVLDMDAYQISLGYILKFHKIACARAHR